MTRITTALLSLFFLFTAHFTLAADTPWDQPLPFASATITYAISGTEQGKEIVYIKDHGKTMATYHTGTTTMLGTTLETNTVEIEDPDWVFSFDLKERTGTKSTNPVKVMKAEYAKLTKAEQDQVRKNAEKLGMTMMEGMSGKVEQNATKLFGFSCDRATFMGTSVYSIHGTPIALKTESEMMGMKMSSVATALDQGPVDDKMFAHPAGIEAVFDQATDAMTQTMAAQTITWMKDPEAANKAAQKQPAGSDQPNISPDDQELMKQVEQMMKGMNGQKTE